MGVTNAERHLALMVEFHPIGNRTFFSLVGNDMRAALATVIPDFPVALAV
jgi:hypothetical protein